MLCCVLQDAYDWGSARVVMDVGGGRGELLSTVMSWAGPDCKGLLLDVQMVIARCEAASPAIVILIGVSMGICNQLPGQLQPWLSVVGMF